MKTLKNVWANKSSKTTKAALATLAVGALSVGTVVANPFMAIKTIQTLMGKAAEIFKELYAGLLVIVSVLAVVIIAWCFLVKMFSKNPRSVEEANQWMKRVAISWLCFMLINILIKVGLDIVDSTGANTATPWD